MKKKLIAMCMATVLSVSSIFAFGIGPQINTDPVIDIPHFYSSGIAPAVACSFKFDNVPVYFAASLNFSPYESSIWRIGTSLTADYWFMNPEIIGIWRWYWGLGGIVRLDFSTHGNFYLSTGPRAVIGMNWHFMDGFLELYTQGAIQPEIQFAFGKSVGDEFWGVPIYLPFNVGLRFYF